MKTGDGTQHRRFAATAWADQACDITTPDVDAKMIYGRPAVVSAFNVLEYKYVFHRDTKGFLDANDSKSHLDLNAGGRHGTDSRESRVLISRFNQGCWPEGILAGPFGCEDDSPLHPRRRFGAPQ